MPSKEILEKKEALKKKQDAKMAEFMAKRGKSFQRTGISLGSLNITETRNLARNGCEAVKKKQVDSDDDFEIEFGGKQLSTHCFG